MLGTNDSKNSIRYDTLGNYRTRFSFEAFRFVKLLPQNPAYSKSGYFKGSTFLYTLYIYIGSLQKPLSFFNLFAREAQTQTAGTKVVENQRRR